jgi:hypothetical protein
MGRRLGSVKIRLVFIGLLSGAVVGGCSRQTGATLSGSVPTMPSALTQGTLDVRPLGASHGLQLTAVSGSGSGVVNVTATAIDGVYTLNTQDSINVHGVPPNTVLYVRGAGDTGLPDGQQSDGTCQRAALGLFGAVALFPGGPAATIETSPGGSGTVHIVDGRNSPFLSDGSTTDIMLRLVDALPPAVPTIDLRTPCFTLLVK